jgi:hypothetical protein
MESLQHHHGHIQMALSMSLVALFILLLLLLLMSPHPLRQHQYQVTKKYHQSTSGATRDHSRGYVNLMYIVLAIRLRNSDDNITLFKSVGTAVQVDTCYTFYRLPHWLRIPRLLIFRSISCLNDS